MSLLLRVCLLWFIFVFVGIAEEGAYFSPMSVGSSARHVRLGGVEGMSNQADSVFENPAALYRIKRFSSSFFTTTLLNEAVYQNMAIAMRLGRIGVFSIGYFNLGVKDIYKTAIDSNDEFTFIVDSTFNYDNSLMKFAYQYSMSRSLHLGISYTSFYTSFDTVSASGNNIDAGLVYRASPFEFSVVVKNLMSSSYVLYNDTEDGSNSSDNQTEKLSLDTIYSLKYKMRHFTMYGQLKSCGANRDLSQGFSVQYNPRYIPYLKGSIGIKRYSVMEYNSGVLELSRVMAISTGFELDLLGVDFNYAFEHNYIGESHNVFYNQNHYFSLGYSF